MTPSLQHHLALDARLLDAVQRIRLLSAVSWPMATQAAFLQNWRAGQPRLPAPDYLRRDMREVIQTLQAIHAQADPACPMGEYLCRTTDSWLVAAELIQSVGDAEVSLHSQRLFGRPGDRLPG